MQRMRTRWAGRLAWCALGCAGLGMAAPVDAETAPVRGEIAVRHVEWFEPAHGIAFRALRAADEGKTQDVLTIGLGEVATDVDSVRASLRDEGYWRGAPGQARLLIECTPAGKPTWMMIDHGLGLTEVDLEKVDLELTITADRVRGQVRSKRGHEFPVTADYRIDLAFDLDWVDLRPVRAPQPR
jgi:hypothetical protein